MAVIENTTVPILLVLMLVMEHPQCLHRGCWHTNGAQMAFRRSRILGGSW